MSRPTSAEYGKRLRVAGLPIRSNRLEFYRRLSSLDDLSHFHRSLSRPIRWADSSGDVMTTSKRTNRGAGSRADNGAATPSPPPQSAAPASTPPPKVRVRQRRSPSSPSTASSNSASNLSHATAAPHPPVDRYASIAQAAYFRSQHRGFKPGHEMEDWLAAEAEVDQRLRREGRTSGG